MRNSQVMANMTYHINTHIEIIDTLYPMSVSINDIGMFFIEVEDTTNLVKYSAYYPVTDVEKMFVTRGLHKTAKDILVMLIHDDSCARDRRVWTCSKMSLEEVKIKVKWLHLVPFETEAIRSCTFKLQRESLTMEQRIARLEKLQYNDVQIQSIAHDDMEEKLNAYAEVFNDRMILKENFYGALRWLTIWILLVSFILWCHSIILYTLHLSLETPMNDIFNNIHVPLETPSDTFSNATMPLCSRI